MTEDAVFRTVIGNIGFGAAKVDEITAEGIDYL